MGVKSMNKLMMSVASLALIGIASPVLAQSTSPSPTSAPPSATAPDSSMTTPNNSSTNMPQDTAPMSSKGSTSAVSPAQGNGQSDTTQSGAPDDQKPAHKMSHKVHHMHSMGTTKASGSKSTDNDAEQLNQQELGKLQSPN
jgi:hypothetical protein